MYVTIMYVFFICMYLFLSTTYINIAMFIFKLCECENSYPCYCRVKYSNIISNEFLEKSVFFSIDTVL